MKIKSFFFQYLPVIISTIILTVCLTYAWTPPSSNPPEGNISAPINTGDTSQSKIGDLNIGGGLKYWITKLGDSFALKNDSGEIKFIVGQDGNVGIGKNDPKVKLDVNGRIKAFDPVDNNDVATKGYVDASSGLDGKNPLVCYVNCSSSGGCRSGYTEVISYGKGKGCTDEEIVFTVSESIGGICWVYVPGSPSPDKYERCYVGVSGVRFKFGTYSEMDGLGGSVLCFDGDARHKDVWSGCSVCCK